MPTSSPSPAEGPPLSSATRRRSLLERSDDLSAPLTRGPRPPRSFHGIRRSPLSPERHSRSTDNRQPITIAPSGSAESVGSLCRPAEPPPLSPSPRPPRSPPSPKRNSRSTANRQPVTIAPSGSVESVGSLCRPAEPSSLSPRPPRSFHGIRRSAPSPKRHKRSTANRQPVTIAPSGSAESVGPPPPWSQDVH